MNQSEFSVPEAAGNSNASVTEDSAVPVIFPLVSPGSFARSILDELVFVICSPARLTGKGQLAVYGRGEVSIFQVMHFNSLCFNFVRFI